MEKSQRGGGGTEDPTETLSAVGWAFEERRERTLVQGQGRSQERPYSGTNSSEVLIPKVNGSESPRTYMFTPILHSLLREGSRHTFVLYHCLPQCGRHKGHDN